MQRPDEVELNYRDAYECVKKPENQGVDEVGGNIVQTVRPYPNVQERGAYELVYAG
jgi:hypothetical protein